MNETTQSSGGTRIQSVARASRILLAIADSTVGCTATEIASLLGVALPTAFHLLNTLTDEGLLTKDRRRYFLGPTAGRLAEAYAAAEATTTATLVPLRWLAETTLETSYLAVWRHGQLIIVDSIEGAQAVKVEGLGIGAAEDAHARASGKVLLSALADESLEAYLATHGLRAATERTITDEQALRKELQKVRRRGYAVDNEEYLEGVVCLGVPISSGERVLGAYALSIPAGRFRANRDASLDALREAARQAERGLAAAGLDGRGSG